MELGTDARVVVAPVEVDGLDVAQQSIAVDIIEGRAEEFDVVAVGAIDGPPDGDTTGHCCIEPRGPTRSIRWAENLVLRCIVNTWAPRD